MKKELIFQLKVVLPLTALILLALLAWRAPASGYICVDFNGWPICYPEPGDE